MRLIAITFCEEMPNKMEFPAKFPGECVEFEAGSLEEGLSLHPGKTIMSVETYLEYKKECDLNYQAKKPIVVEEKPSEVVEEKPSEVVEEKPSLPGVVIKKSWWKIWGKK